MLDLGWPELLVIAIVLIVVVGPKDLPRMLRTFGRTTSKLRAMAGDFRKQFDDALKEAELDDVKDLASSARKLDPRSELKKHLSPLQQAGQDVRAGLDDVMKPKPSTAREPASETAHAAEPAKTGATGTPGKTVATDKPASEANGAGAPAKPKPAASKKTAAAAKKPAARKPAATSKAAASTSGKKKTTTRAGGTGNKAGSAT